MSNCKKIKKTVYSFLAKVSFFKLVDYIPRLSNHCTIERRLERRKTNTFEGGGIRPNELTQFPLRDHVSIYTYRNEHYLYIIDFFDVFMHFELR